MATFPAVIGAPSVLPTDRKEFRKQATRNRKEAEHRISNALIGKTSGLSEADQENLRDWDSFFHEEVHGGKISLMRQLTELSKGRFPKIGPSYDQDACALYMNRAAEIGWMTVKLLPLLQPFANAFEQRWEDDRLVLEDSFRYMVVALGNLGKPIASSFIKMMDERFVFRTPLSYFEADGKSAVT